MNNTSDCNKSTSILSFGLVGVPVDDWKLFKRNTPVESLSLLVELLLELLKTALLDFVGLELLKVIGEAELLPHPDRPLGWVILMPFDSVTVVGGEFVMEVVVAFSKSNESSDDVVSRRVTVIERLVTKPMSQRVDTESSLLNEEDSENTGVDETTKPITPTKTCNETRKDHAHKDDSLDVVAVLPNNDWVIVQVGDVGTANTLWVLLHDHPSEVRVYETLSY